MLIQADAALIPFPDQTFHCAVFSPPYWGLRKYAGEQGRIWGGDPDCEHEWGEEHLKTGPKKWDTATGQVYPNQTTELTVSQGCFCQLCSAWYGGLGLEPTPELHIEHMVEIFREIRRVLRDDGVVWLNYGDCYSAAGWESNRRSVIGQGSFDPVDRKSGKMPNLAAGNLMMMPHKVAIALQNDGWIVRNDLIWFKRNPMPESVSGWTWQRHRVRISHHAYLSNMSEERSGNKQDRTSNVSSVQEGKDTLKATGVSEDRSGSRSKSQVRPKRKSKEVGKEIQTIGEGSGYTENSKTKALRGKSRKVSGAMARMEQNPSEPSCPETLCGKQERQEKESRSSRTIQKVSEGTSSSGEKRGKAASESSISGSNLDCGRVGKDQGSTQPSMLLLQSQDGTVDDGSCNSSEQRGEAHQGECSTSVSELQQQERGKALETVLIDCPGCEKCNPHNGYILKKGSFRHTRAHEYIFQLVKEMNYYSNQEAVREAQTGGTHSRGTKLSPPKEKAGADAGHGHRDFTRYTPDTDVPGGRNPRSVLDVPTAPYKGAHYATFPPNLIAPLIRASCPKRCCPECGAPWAPVVEKTQGKTQHSPGGDKEKIAHETARGKHGATSLIYTGGGVQTNVLDYRPTCSCGRDDHIPGIVLDPFMGSGTTGAVARELGRRWVGLDISMEYLDQQAKVRALNWTPSNALDDLPLFGGFPKNNEPKQDTVGKRTYTGFNKRWKEKSGE